MKVLVSLEYEVTGDIKEAVMALRDTYRFYQGRAESLGGGSPEFYAKCTEMFPRIALLPENEPVIDSLRTLRSQCTEGSDVADVLDSCIERLEKEKSSEL